MEVAELPPAPAALVAPVAELDEAAPPGALASAFGASGVGEGDGVGDAVGAVGAGAGAGATTFSSFLQAVRPIARIAATMSERVIIFSFGN